MVRARVAKLSAPLIFGPYGNFRLSARPLARPHLGANAHIQRPHYLLSPKRPFPTTFVHRRWSYGLMSGASLWDEMWVMMIDCIQMTPISEPTTGAESSTPLRRAMSLLLKKSPHSIDGITHHDGPALQSNQNSLFGPQRRVQPECPMPGPGYIECHLTCSEALSSPLFRNTIPNDF